MYFTSNYESPLGGITLATDEKNLVGLWFVGQKYYADTLKNSEIKNAETAVATTTKRWLEAYFEGRRPSIRHLPLGPAGSDFRLNVWELLCQIPYGEVTTYGALGKKMAVIMGRQSMSGQAVGGAVGRNPISIIIPCHRVIGANGSLTGFAGGIDKKIQLLEMEGLDISTMVIPVKGTAL